MLLTVIGCLFIIIAILIMAYVIWETREEKEDPCKDCPHHDRCLKWPCPRAENWSDSDGSQPLCVDCPDHEACMTNWPCSVVKSQDRLIKKIKALGEEDERNV